LIDVNEAFRQYVHVLLSNNGRKMPSRSEQNTLAESIEYEMPDFVVIPTCCGLLLFDKSDFEDSPRLIDTIPNDSFIASRASRCLSGFQRLARTFFPLLIAAATMTSASS
jgi:hypothetical protein